MKKIIGLIGAGYWGKNILRNLYELDCLRSVCDSNPLVIDQYKEKYPEVNYTNSIFELLNNKEIKGVVIASPAATHFEIVKHCLNANKNVLVEKPLSLNIEDGKILVNITGEKKLILMVGHILHYHPAVWKIKDIIASGEIGKLQYIYSHRLNIGKLRTEENILWSFAPHDISIILSLVNEMPETINTFGGNYVTPGVYDTTLTNLKFSSGVRAHIFVSWLHPVKEQRLVIVGSKSMIVFDDLTDEKLFLYRHRIEWENGKIPVAHKSEAEIIPVAKSEPLKNELKHFIECISGNKKPLTDGEEALRVLEVLERSQKSLESGTEYKKL